MKILPSAADSSLYGWEVLLMLLLAALLPAVAIFVWAIFFRKKWRRKSRRRRRGYSAANPATLRSNGARRAAGRESAPRESKS